MADDIAEAVEIALETNNATLLEKIATKGDIVILKEDIADLRAKIIKWMFIFIMGQFWAIIAVLFVFFK